MTVSQIAEALELKVLAGEEGLDRPVTGGYCGDLLSWVMGRAQEGDAWITVMGNLNSIAVASLADTACIILAERAEFDEDAKARADDEEIPVLGSGKPAYMLAVELARCLE